MSIQLVHYSDSEESQDSDNDNQHNSNDSGTKNRKRNRSEIDTDADIKDNSNDSNNAIEKEQIKEPSKKKIKLCSINIEDKLSNNKNDKIEFLDSNRKQQKDSMLHKGFKKALNKINANNEQRLQQIHYKKHLKQMEEEKMQKEEGLRRKKQHKKYLKSSLKQHIVEYGDKVKVKGIGKGSHTKNQRVAW